MVHAALLLLMFETANANLVSTISLKRSTQNLSYPQAAQPINPSVGETRRSASVILNGRNDSLNPSR
jgi:hypothetical protein